MPQGLPKFLSASFVQVSSNGIGHALLGPAHVSTSTLANTSVNIICDTNYPFSPNLNYNVISSEPFTFHLRVPTWYLPNSSFISVDNGEVYAPTPDPHTGMTAVPLPAGNSTVSYTISANIRTEPRANSTVAIYHGALLYALDVGQSVATVDSSLYNISYADGAPYNTSCPLLPQEIHDFTFTNTRPWNIAIDTSTLTFHTTLNNTPEPALPNPIFDYGAPPTYITGKGCEIDWPLYKGLPAPLPALPKAVSHRNCTGNVTDLVFRPYGSLKNHMAELPTVDLSAIGK